MPNYVLAYKGGGGMASDEAERQRIMAAWGEWFGKLGPAIVDGGNPFGASKTVNNGGAVSDGAASELSGYSVLSADTIDAAAEHARGCPVLAAGGTVEVYETVAVM
jgi:hypothetical protein